MVCLAGNSGGSSNSCALWWRLGFAAMRAGAALMRAGPLLQASGAHCSASSFRLAGTPTPVLEHCINVCNNLLIAPTLHSFGADFLKVLMDLTYVAGNKAYICHMPGCLLAEPEGVADSLQCG